MLEKEVIDAVQEIADEENRSFSSMLNILLKKTLEKKKWKKKKKCKLRKD